jgi:hypothetical protein
MEEDLYQDSESFIEGLLDIKKPVETEQESPGKAIEESIPSILSKLEETIRRVKA